jgi:hypothetical protein
MVVPIVAATAERANDDPPTFCVETDKMGAGSERSVIKTS